MGSEYAIKGDRVYPRIRRWTVRGQPTDVAILGLLNKPDNEVLLLHTISLLLNYINSK